MPSSLSFVAGVRLDTSGSGGARIVGPGGIVVIVDHSPGVINAVQRLAEEGLTYDVLVGGVLAGADLAGLRTLHECLAQLFARGWLAHRVCYRGRPSQPPSL